MSNNNANKPITTNPDVFNKTAGPDEQSHKTTLSQRLRNSGLYNSEKEIIKNYPALTEEIYDWLDEQGWDKARACLDLLLVKSGNKFRDDKITPSTLHELTQFIWLIDCYENDTSLPDPVERLACLVFIHDLMEDTGLTSPMLKKCFEDQNCVVTDEFLTELMLDLEAISKRTGPGQEKKYPKNQEYLYFKSMTNRINAVINKILDRAHNVMTLVGAKDQLFMYKYTNRTEVLINDFVRDTKKDFPEMEQTLDTQLRVLKLVTQIARYYSDDTGKPLPDNEELRQELQGNLFKDLPDGLHPLLCAAQRIREQYPHIHMAANNDNNRDLDFTPET